MLIDTFPFNRDFRPLKIRLQEVGDLVDLIVISESRLTHSGIPKPLHLSNNLDTLDRFKKKVEIVSPTEEDLKVSNPRIREMVQRQAISKFIKSLKLSKDDFIFHSDCDEIPRHSVLEHIVCNKLLGSYLFELRNFANALNLEDGTWKRGRLISYKFYKDIQQMRKDVYLEMVFESRKLPFGIFRTPDFWTRRKRLFSLPDFESRPKMTLVKEAGWHFNNLLSRDEVLKKIEHSSHSEWNTQEVRKVAEERFLEDKDIYNGREFKRVELDSSYPKMVLENLEDWKEFIR